MKRTWTLALVLVLLFSAVAEEALVKLSHANFIPRPAPKGIRITNEEDIIGKILRDEDTYTLVSDINETIVVDRSNIVIDGSGHKLMGDGDSTGIFLQDVNNVTLKNLLIMNFEVGILLTYGWGTRGCENNTLSENILRNNSIGIELDLFTGNNVLTKNVIENGDAGIVLHYSSGNRLRNNQINGNKYNLYITSYLTGSTSDFINDIDESNTINGKPIIYWVNQQDKVVPSNAGYVGLVGCKNITVQGLCITNNSQGVLMVATDRSNITGNRLKNNKHGIVLFGYQKPCRYNTITANIIAENEEGINILVDWLDKDFKNHNIFHHNNLINNTVQVSPYSYGGIWDDGSEGNYWSNYNGTDLDGDGIGDSPYVVVEAHTYDWDTSIVKGSTDVDHYPFMYPCAPPFISIVCPKNETYHTSSVPLNFTVSEPDSWMKYSLDGNENVTITGNTTLFNLSAGSHSLTLYATDIFGNTGASGEVYFTIDAPPNITILSPQNKTYNTTDIPLTFNIDKTATWIGYSLNGQANVTITGNTTLTGLADGAHSITVYANNTAGNTAASETIHFSTAQPAQSLPTSIAAVSVAAATAGLGFLVYLKRRGTKNKHADNK